MFTIRRQPPDEEDLAAYAVVTTGVYSGFVHGPLLPLGALVVLTLVALVWFAFTLVVWPVLVALVVLALVSWLLTGSIVGWIVVLLDRAVIGVGRVAEAGQPPRPEVLEHVECAEIRMDCAWIVREQYDDPGIPRTLARVGPDLFVLLGEPPGTFGDDGQALIPAAAEARLHLYLEDGQYWLLRDVSPPERPTLALSDALGAASDEAIDRWLETARNYVPMNVQELPEAWRQVVLAAPPAALTPRDGRSLESPGRART
jgi:hypothetical protein